MSESIIDGRGSGTPWGINGSNAGLVSQVDSNPNDVNKNNPAWQFLYMTSGTATGITTGSAIGSIVQFIGGGSFVQTLTYSNNVITNVGSWV